LAQSLEHIGERSRDVISFNEDALSLLVDRLRGGYRFPPATFALYYDLVDAVLDERLEDAQALFGELCLQTPVSAPLAIARLDPAIMGARMVDRCCRMVDTDDITRFAFKPPASQAAENFPKQCDEAIALMARADPELAGEFGELVCEIVLAGGQSTDGKIRFAGASSFLLWGAIVVNPSAHDSPVSLIEGLVHESAHSLLFGLMIDEPLVLNRDWERFQSPLRDDLRPIDGIYHATFVVARVHYAMRRLLASGLLDGADEEEVTEMLAMNRKAFTEGLSTVERHGRLTNRGTAVMTAAKSYMERVSLGA
jgi:HEXXH motif-containing protein